MYEWRRHGEPNKFLFLPKMGLTKKKSIMNYELLLRTVFWCFHGQKFIFYSFYVVQGAPLGFDIKYLKIWFNQMFWQIYQELMLSGFLSSGNFCLIHHLKLFWPQSTSITSVRKSAMIPYISEQLDFWWSIVQKMTSIGYFGASDDQTSRIRFFWGNWHL